MPSVSQRDVYRAIIKAKTGTVWNQARYETPSFRPKITFKEFRAIIFSAGLIRGEITALTKWDIAVADSVIVPTVGQPSEGRRAIGQVDLRMLELKAASQFPRYTPPNPELYVYTKEQFCTKEGRQ